MTRVRKFLNLSARNQFLLMKAASLVALFRLGLWLLPFRAVLRLRDRMLPKTSDSHVTNQAVLRKTAWAVTVTSRYVPEATCLTQALAAQVLLSRQGYPADLRIGVAKSETNQLEAHAWTECEGQVVIGGEDSPTIYTVLPSLAGKGQ